MITTCDKPATHRFTWPGYDESFICKEHLPKLEAVAAALGLYLQIVELSEDSKETCRQKSQR